MNLSSYIAKRITGHHKSSFSNFIIRLSTAATVISVAVMIIAAAVVQGFKDTIKDKAFEFWGHFHISQSTATNDLMISPKPILFDSGMVASLKREPHILDVEPYTLGAGIIATELYNEGVRIKGVGPSYFKGSKDNVITYGGHPIRYNDTSYAADVILSQAILDKIGKQAGDDVLLYVLDKEESLPRVRKVRIAGTYHMGIEEIDNNFILCDIKLLQRLYNWNDGQVTGYQVLTDDYEHADPVAEEVYFKYLSIPQTIVYISDIYSEIFQWLELQNVNARIILTIMAVVAVINMITALLTFILERVNMIGILKALGMNNWEVRKIFVYHISRIVLKGILGGVLLGLFLCLLQYYFHIISIDESIYYMKYVPIKIVPWHVAGIIIGTFVVSVLILAVPTLIIRKINIVEAIRYQ